MYPLGLPIPPLEELYNQVRDPTIKPEELTPLVLPHLVRHYDNDSPLFYQAFNATSLESFPSRWDFCTQLKWKPIEEPPFDESVYDPITEKAALLRSSFPILMMDHPLYADCTDKLVFDAEYAEKYFPRMTVECVVASKGSAETCYGMWGLKRKLLERDDTSEKPGRRFRFHIFEGANHMVSKDVRNVVCLVQND